MVKLVNLVNPEVVARNADAAAFFRGMAECAERGEVGDYSVVWDDLKNMCYASKGDFADRWRLLAALEYAKAQAARDG
jgi:hypothetical protein